MKHFALLSCLLVASISAHAKLYKWVDDNGVVQYGDKIPSKYLHQQHQELNSHGVPLRNIERKKTQKEIRAEREAQSAEQRLEAEKRRQIAERARKDQILLDTFTVERDILLMRDDRLNSIDSTINITNIYNTQIQEQLENTQKRIANLENAGKDVPENLLKKIQNLSGQLNENLAHVARLKKDRILLEKQFEDDLHRFRELKGISTKKQDNLDNEVLSGNTEVPVPKGYFYGYPIFPTAENSNRYDTFKSEYMYLETTASMDVIKSFFKQSPEIGQCTENRYGYSCPAKTQDGEGKVTITISGWQKRGKQTSTSIRYKHISKNQRGYY